MTAYSKPHSQVLIILYTHSCSNVTQKAVTVDSWKNRFKFNTTFSTVTMMKAQLQKYIRNITSCQIDKFSILFQSKHVMHVVL